MQDNLEFSNNNMFILEGNIGSGKSTFLNILKENLDLDFIDEPTNKWQNIGSDGNLLDLFYKDAKRWAYTFQSYAFISRVQSLVEYFYKNKNLNRVQILERSVYCDRYCFAKNCFELGSMTALEWQIYKDLFAWLVEKYSPKPKGFIYLRVSPTTCMKRIKKRNRPEEKEISLNYLEKLHKKHEDWLINRIEITTDILNIPILILECDSDFKYDIKEQNKHIENVVSFIENQRDKSFVNLFKLKKQQL